MKNKQLVETKLVRQKKKKNWITKSNTCEKKEK